MNWAQFKKNIGMRVQLEPVACRLDANGHQLPDENDDWIVTTISDEDVVSLQNIRTGHVAQLGKDHIYDFRSNPGRSTAGVVYGFLVLKMQLFLQGPNLWLRPNGKPGERMPPHATARVAPAWTPFQKVDVSKAIPPIAASAKVQYRLWSQDPNIPLMIRVASRQDGTMTQEMSGPSGVAEQMITEPQTFYVSLSHARVQYEIGVLGFELRR
jgi:hypothetical protein